MPYSNFTFLSAKKLLLAVALIFSPVISNAATPNYNAENIPNLLAAYFSISELQPKLWLNQGSISNTHDLYSSDNQSLSVQLISGGVNIPEFPLRVVKVTENEVRLESVGLGK